MRTTVLVLVLAAAVLVASAEKEEEKKNKVDIKVVKTDDRVQAQGTYERQVNDRVKVYGKISHTRGGGDSDTAGEVGVKFRFRRGARL